MEEYAVDHVIGASCWCKPRAMQSCPECWHGGPSDAGKRIEEYGYDAEFDPCWKCGDKGFVEVYDESLPVVYLHNWPLSRDAAGGAG